MKNFIIAPTSPIARMIEQELKTEFNFSERPVHIIQEHHNDSFARMHGIERANVFVAVSGREFLSVQEWPKFVKQLRLHYESRMMRGHASFMSKWIEVFLP